MKRSPHLLRLTQDEPSASPAKRASGMDAGRVRGQDAPGGVAGTPKIAQVGSATLAIFCTPRLAGHALDYPRDGGGSFHKL